MRLPHFPLVGASRSISLGAVAASASARIRRRLVREAFGAALRAMPLGQPRGPQGRGGRPSGQPRRQDRWDNPAGL
eukprot:3355277-Pyramimonas_sp.AAC.1